MSGELIHILMKKKSHKNLFNLLYVGINYKKTLYKTINPNDSHFDISHNEVV